MREIPEVVRYQDRIFDGAVSMQAWGIASRIKPSAPTDTAADKEARAGLAIAAQIGINSSRLISEREERLVDRLSRIRELCIEGM